MESILTNTMNSNIDLRAYLKVVEIESDEVKKRNNIHLDSKNKRYDLIKYQGYSKGIEALVTLKGLFYLTLLDTRGIIKGHEDRMAEKRLQAPKSVNFSSIYMTDKVTSDGLLIAFGNPPKGKSYGGKTPRPNPFYDERNDGFVFLISPDWKWMEIVIVRDGEPLIQSYCQKFADGKLDECLASLRMNSHIFHEY